MYKLAGIKLKPTRQVLIQKKLQTLQFEKLDIAALRKTVKWLKTCCSMILLEVRRTSSSTLSWSSNSVAAIIIHPPRFLWKRFEYKQCNQEPLTTLGIDLIWKLFIIFPFRA